MTVNDVLNYNKIFKAMIDNNNGISALLKFKFLSVCKQFEPVVANFETVREEKINQYSTDNSDGRIGIIAPNKDDYDNDDDYNKAREKYEDSIKKFSDDINELLNSEADIEIKKIKASDIMDKGLSSDYLVAIFDLIEEE